MSQFIDPLGFGEIPLNCQWCGGSGHDRTATDSRGIKLPCRACGGVGTVIVPPPFLHCRRCGGGGHDTNAPMEAGYFGRCPACGGTGYAHAKK